MVRGVDGQYLEGGRHYRGEAKDTTTDEGRRPQRVDLRHRVGCRELGWPIGTRGSLLVQPQGLRRVPVGTYWSRSSRTDRGADGGLAGGSEAPAAILAPIQGLERIHYHLRVLPRPSPRPEQDRAAPDLSEPRERIDAAARVRAAQGRAQAHKPWPGGQVSSRSASAAAALGALGHTPAAVVVLPADAEQLLSILGVIAVPAAGDAAVPAVAAAAAAHAAVSRPESQLQQRRRTRRLWLSDLGRAGSGDARIQAGNHGGGRPAPETRGRPSPRR